jgi:hypothetical protein
MSYSDQALLSNDQDFLQRLAACGASEHEVPADVHPTLWASEQVWAVAAAPGFADAYASALASGVDRPGWDPAVISDEMLLSAVQALP